MSESDLTRTGRASSPSSANSDMFATTGTPLAHTVWCTPSLMRYDLRAGQYPGSPFPSIWNYRWQAAAHTIERGGAGSAQTVQRVVFTGAK